MIGLGTYRLTPDQCYTMVKRGLKLGYRHIDTAALYRNEEAVGRAIRDSGVERKEIFLTTKVHRKNIAKGTIREGVSTSLEKLGTYIDLLLLHNVTDNFVQAWRCLQDIKKWPQIMEVGVSNFRIDELRLLSPKPSYNQIEVSPFLPRDHLVAYCAENKIRVVAHSSLIKGERFDHPELLKLASRLEITPAQLLIGWAIRKGYIVLPRTSNKEHLKENLDKVHLCDEVMEELVMIEDGYATHPKLL